MRRLPAPLMLAVLLVLACVSGGCSQSAVPSGGASATGGQPNVAQTAPAAAGGAPSERTPTAGPLTRVRAAHAVVSTGVGALWLAAEQGLFERHGLDLELTLISGTPIVMASLIAGEIRFAQTAGDSALSAQLRDPNIVSFLNASGPSLHRMMVQPDLRRPEDLRGKRAGVFTLGDGNYALISKAMLKLGMDPDRDVVWTPVGGGNMGGLLAALAAGSIDAALLTPPNDVLAERNGARELFRLRELDLPNAGLPIFTSRRLIDEQRPVAEAFARGYVDGIQLLRSDPARAKEMFGRRLNIGEPDLLEYTYTTLAAEGIKERPFPELEQTRAVLETLLPQNPELRDLQLERVMDSSIMEALDRQGYLGAR